MPVVTGLVAIIETHAGRAIWISAPREVGLTLTGDST